MARVFLMWNTRSVKPISQFCYLATMLCRSISETFKCAMLVRAAAATAGGMAVVKIKPLEKERIKSKA